MTAALRRLVDPEKIARFLIDTISNPTNKTSDRLKACEMLIDRLEGKAQQSIELTASVAAPSLPSNWAELSTAQRKAFLDEIEEQRDAGVLALPERSRG